MHIAWAQPVDAEKLTHIAFAAKRHWGYSEKWIETWRPALTIEPAFIINHETYVAVLNDLIVGFYATQPTDEVLELAHLWVLPGMMGKGVGRSLFTHSVGRARELGFRQIKIESDPHAEGFYLRMGARRLGANLTELDGQRRELPVLIYHVAP